MILVSFKRIVACLASLEVSIKVQDASSTAWAQALSTRSDFFHEARAEFKSAAHALGTSGAGQQAITVMQP